MSEYMMNPENAYCCEGCPENRGFSAWPEHRNPCGQFNCWIELYTAEDEDDEDDYEYDHCYECSGYGDDYFVNDDGELESTCPTCPFFENQEESYGI